MAKSDKDKERDDIALLNFGNMFRLGADTRSEGNIPTGHFELDFILHYGESPSEVDLSSYEGYDPSATLGLPLGKLTEIFGEEGSGKSSLAHRVCGYAQKLGHRVAWIDCENSYSNDLAAINGVDRSQVIFSDLVDDVNPDNTFFAEDIMDKIIEIIKNGNDPRLNSKVKVVVLDSVANLTPRVIGEASAEKNHVGVIARLLSENLKKITNHAAKYGVLVIFINQVREKIGVMFGNPETTPGGRALRFNASVRIRVGKMSVSKSSITVTDDKGKEREIGARAYVRITKNRFAKPYRESLKIPIYYEPYFPDIDDHIFDIGRQLKIIKPYKGEFRWTAQKVAVEGRDEFMDYIKFNGLRTKLLSVLAKEAEEHGVILTPEVAQEIENLSDEIEKLSKESSTKKDSDADGEGTVAKSTKRRRKAKAG